MKLTTKLDSESEHPKFVIDMPRMGKVREGSRCSWARGAKQGVRPQGA